MLEDGKADSRKRRLSFHGHEDLNRSGFVPRTTRQDRHGVRAVSPAPMNSHTATASFKLTDDKWMFEKTREREKERERQTETERQRQTDRQTETETDRQTDRQTDGRADKQTDRQRKREREREEGKKREKKERLCLNVSFGFPGKSL